MPVLDSQQGLMAREWQVVVGGVLAPRDLAPIAGVRFLRDPPSTRKVAGWTALRFTWRDLTERPQRVIRTIRAMIESRTAAADLALPNQMGASVADLHCSPGYACEDFHERSRLGRR